MSSTGESPAKDLSAKDDSPIQPPTNNVIDSTSVEVASLSNTDMEDERDTTTNTIDDQQKNRVGISEPAKEPKYKKKPRVLMKWVVLFTIGFLIAYGCTWLWPISGKDDLPVCPNTGTWIDTWIKVSDVFESLYFGLGFAFCVVVIPKVHTMQGALRRRIALIAVFLSFFMLSWFWHARLHETFCGYWGVILLDVLFHIPVSVMSVLIMKYCVILMRRFSYSSTSTNASMDILSRAQWIGFSVFLAVATAVLSFLVLYYLPPYTSVAPSPPPCGWVPGCPVEPCQVPLFCTDLMCPELASACPVQTTPYTMQQCYASGQVNPTTGLPNSDTLTNECTAQSAEFPCNPPTGYNTTTCNALPFATTAPDCQPVPTSPPPTTCMNGQLSAMALPVILPQCNMGEIDNMCLLCTLYRNYQIPQPSCYRLLDGSQTTWEDPTDLEYAFIVLYTVFDSALFLVAGLFAVVAIPLALKLPNEKHQRTQFMLFTLAIIWNCGSWLVHSTVHGVAEKPMPAWKWLTITIVFHWGTMLASAVIVYCMFEIITLSYAYSKSEMRTTQPGVTTQPQGMGQPDGTQTSGEWGSRDMPLDTAAALWHSADVLRDEGVGVRDNEGVGVGVNEARVAHVEMAERALHVGSDTHAHEV